MKLLESEKILIGLSSFAVHDKTPLERLQETGCRIVENPYKRRLIKNEIMDLLGGSITGVIAGLEPFDREVLENTKLKIISRCGSGISNVDLKAAEEFGIKVCVTPDAPTESVAEITVAGILSLLRNIPQMNEELHNGRWAKKIGTELRGKTVAIIGFGRIGRRVASLIKPFNVRIIAVDPDEGIKMEGVEFSSLNKALQESDIVTIHTSGEKEIIGKDEFGLIKHGSFLLNAARGKTISEKSLIDALGEGRVKGAWLDTFTTEPYNGQLKKYPQVIMTPHIASNTLECRSVMEMEAVNNLIRELGKDYG